MIMRPRCRHKDIKYTGCFSKLDLLGPFQGEAKIVETGPIERPADVGSFATLRHAVNANKVDRDKCDANGCPSEKAPAYPKFLTPTFFPLPCAQSLGCHGVGIAEKLRAPATYYREPMEHGKHSAHYCQRLHGGWPAL
ncbi:hypothetical protein AU381_17020 [Sinorhizobium glycinis]|uniref:Uncharacterized protein n=1 Tax=Sinorhizobium glycinis TaxID=1472378 RepID=A0A178XRG8_9HYPH|nr:hypothetical protein AU381_17020 [Sinorhizobium glycinis]